MKIKTILKGAAILLGLFVLIQFIPFGRNHTNPAVTNEPAWANPQTRALAQRACFDCHSNETVWPWYSNIAPISWLIERDVVEGRQVINFSNWVASSGAGSRFNRSGGNEITEVIMRNSMPPFYYVMIHPDAGLSTTEKDELILGLQSTLAAQK